MCFDGKVNRFIDGLGVRCIRRKRGRNDFRGFGLSN